VLGAIRQYHLAFLHFVELQLGGERRRYAQNVGSRIDQGANDLWREPALACITDSEIAVDETNAFPRLRRNRIDILLSSLAHMQADYVVRLCRNARRERGGPDAFSPRILTPCSHGVHFGFSLAGTHACENSRRIFFSNLLHRATPYLNMRARCEVWAKARERCWKLR
jgi:hypothetical protein